MEDIDHANYVEEVDQEDSVDGDDHLISVGNIGRAKSEEDINPV